MPLDPNPHPDGTVVLRHVDGQPRGLVLRRDELPAQEPAWVPHWVTCPDSEQFRGRKARTVPRCTVCGKPLDAELALREPRWTTHPSCDQGGTAMPTEFRALVDMARDEHTDTSPKPERREAPGLGDTLPGMECAS